MLMLGRKQVSPGYFPFKPIESATNCILEIPQNIKMTLENNVLTLKAGSILTLTGSTYATHTTTSDITLTISSSFVDGIYMVFSTTSGMHQPRLLSNVTSGSAFPTENLSNLSVFFNTSDKKIYRYFTDTSTWGEFSTVYPICLIQITSGVASFAKDSNGNDIIFNGFGFVGQTKYILPGVSMLLSAGKNIDGTNRNINYINNSLQLSTSGGTYIRRIFIRDAGLQVTTNPYYYDNSANLWYDQEGHPLTSGCVYIGDCDTINGIVTNFTINPPLGYWRYFVKMVQ